MKELKILLTVILIMAISAAVKAQDVYEYASIAYSASMYAKYKISITKEGKYELIEGKLSETTTASLENLTPVLEYLNKFSKDGWDNYSNSVARYGGEYMMYFFLRKKKS